MKLQIKIRKIIDFGEIRSGWIISHALLSPMVLSEVANKILAWWLSFWKASWEFFENSRISRISRKSSICVISSECSNGLVTSMRSCACFRIPKNPWRSGVVPVRSWLLVLKIMFCKRVAGQSCTWWCSGVTAWFRYHVPTTVQAWNTGRTGALDDDHCEGEFPNGLVSFGPNVCGPSVTVSLQEVWTQGVAQSMQISTFWSSNWNSKSRGCVAGMILCQIRRSQQTHTNTVRQSTQHKHHHRIQPQFRHHPDIYPRSRCL